MVASSGVLVVLALFGVLGLAPPPRRAPRRAARSPLAWPECIECINKSSCGGCGSSSCRADVPTSACVAARGASMLLWRRLGPSGVLLLVIERGVRRRPSASFRHTSMLTL